VTNKVLEIDRGSAYMHVPTSKTAGSGYAAYLAGRIEREERAATAEQVRKNLARTELAWLRRGAPARTTKPKARMDAAKELVSRKAEGPARQGELGLSLGSQRLGSKGIELQGIAFSWPASEKSAEHEVLHAFDYTLEPGDRLGIVGPNGAGKSTLLDLIAGRLKPTGGHVDVGGTVKIGYYDQLGRELNLSQTVREAVMGDKGNPSVEDINLMKRFWFDGDSQFAPLSTLSGGERRRLQLLLTLIEQPNVLMLDEPTNDLDLDTLRALEEYLDDWPGIVVVVSHDRVFLDRTVIDVLALDGEGGTRQVVGGIAGWLQQRGKQTTNQTAPKLKSAPALDSAQPTKVKPAKSPSTLRRLLGQTEKTLAQATEKLQKLEREMSAVGNDHVELARVSAELALAQQSVDAAEEHWLTIAAEAESQGITSSKYCNRFNLNSVRHSFLTLQRLRHCFLRVCPLTVLFLSRLLKNLQKSLMEHTAILSKMSLSLFMKQTSLAWATPSSCRPIPKKSAATSLAQPNRSFEVTVLELRLCSGLLSMVTHCCARRIELSPNTCAAT